MKSSYSHCRMAVLETTLGDAVIDLYREENPRASLNFLKLCKIKFYNYCFIDNDQRDFIIQTGDPMGTVWGGESISGETLDYLDGIHTVFGEVTEGMDVLMKINEAFVDMDFLPFQDIRINHTVILDDPLDDPHGLPIPDRSPEPTKEQLVVKSFKTGKPESLCYAFIEFEKEEDTEKVYFKMDNVLIDDWRIYVDFSLFRRLNGKGKHRRDSLENRYRDQVTMERKAERRCSRSRSRSRDNDNHKHNKSKGDGDRERRDRSQSPRKCKDKERSQHR